MEKIQILTYLTKLGAYEIQQPGENKYAFYFEVGDSKSAYNFWSIFNTER